MKMARLIKNSVLVCVALVSLAQAAEACTGIMLKNKDGSVVRGRTVEFGITIESSIAVVPRGYRFVGQTPKGEGLQYTAKYAAIGAMAFKDVKILDGLNEKGLAAGAFYFPTFAGYTPVTSENQKEGLSPADFPNWILTQFATVDEVRQAVESGSAVITPTVISGWGPEAPPFHYVVYDETGACIVVEPVAGKLVVHKNPLGVMSNSPTFDWHMTNLRNYIALRALNVPPIQIADETLKPLGQGSGMLGLPGDFTPPSRFVRAAVFTITAIPSDNAAKGIQQVFHILNNFDIPVGVAREQSGGVMDTDYTMLTVASDPNSLRYYYKTYDDQTIRMLDLKKFDLDAKSIKLLSTKSDQPIVDMTDHVK